MAETERGIEYELHGLEQWICRQYGHFVPRLHCPCATRKLNWEKTGLSDYRGRKVGVRHLAGSTADCR